MKLQMIFRQWYVVFIDEYTDVQTPMKLHMIFCWLYDKILEGNANWMKQINCFWPTLFVRKFIDKFIIDGLTNRPKITNKIFADGLFLFMNLLVKYLPKIMNINIKKKIIDKTIKFYTIKQILNH
jgi:hypothetical protein